MLRAYLALFAFASLMGALDALLLRLLALPAFCCNVLHGFLLTIFVLENYTFFQDLRLCARPTEEIIITNKIQTEVIWQLKVRNFDLRQQILKAERPEPTSPLPPPSKFKHKISRCHSHTWHSLWDKHCSPATI
jgi:hypothetical protein